MVVDVCILQYSSEHLTKDLDSARAAHGCTPGLYLAILWMREHEAPVSYDTAVLWCCCDTACEERGRCWRNII